MADELKVLAEANVIDPTASASQRAVPKRIVRRRWWRGDHATYRLAKRGLDIMLSTVGIVVLSPIMLACLVAITLDSPGPAIFRQVRIGHRGKPFVMYKFRGMYVDARERFRELYSYDYSTDQISHLRFHLHHDPRVTKVGRFLRKTSLDELPNLFNVLKGDMSLVGPRPEIPEMLPYYGEAREMFLSVKPGVTSLAKVLGRDELTFPETLAKDLEYVLTRSVWVDIKTIAATVVSVARREGVY